MSAIAPMDALAWERPAALVLFVLPIAVVLAARVFERPLEMATGTLSVWERAGTARTPRTARARRRIPPAVWLLAAGLALGALALAGPRAEHRASPRRFRVLVDRSPSMDLLLGTQTRGERATAMAREWLARNTNPVDEIVWQERASGFGPEDDEEGTLWVTDRAPEPSPLRAGFVASGGPAVPGPIALDGSTGFHWDGRGIVEVPGGAPVRRVAVSGPLPAPIRGMLEVWADARDVRVDSTGAGPDALVLVVAGPASSDPRPGRTVEVGRDGWKALAAVRASAPSSDAAGSLETWLADQQIGALVTWRAGRIESALDSMEDPQGDPAAFAVSWAELFDAAALPPPGVVELGERTAAGEEAVSLPTISAGPGAAAPRAPVDAWLAAAAVALVAVAWSLAGWPGLRG